MIEKMTTDEPTSEIVKEITNQSTTHDIIAVLKMIVQYLESFTMDKMSRDVMSAAADRLEAQEQTIAALTARAEQSERERDALLTDFSTIERDGLCEVCFFGDSSQISKEDCMEDCCFNYRTRRGLPQDGKGE